MLREIAADKGRKSDGRRGGLAASEAAAGLFGLGTGSVLTHQGRFFFVPVGLDGGHAQY